MISSIKIIFLFIIVLFFNVFTSAQDTSLFRISREYAICTLQSDNKTPVKPQLKLRTFIIPAAGIGYGILAQNNKRFNQFDQDLKNSVLPADRSRKLNADNYLQIAPGLISLALTASGVKGKQNIRDAGMSYLLTNILVNTIVFPSKRISHRLRPDSSSYSSFPSGHTAEAFANAEFLRMQYGRRYPLLAVSGYAMAAATGYLRMYNNKHWFSDVVTGAAIGFCSARIAGWMYTKIQPRLFPDIKKTKGKITSITPAF